MQALSVLTALLKQLVRAGVIGAEQIDAMASDLDRDGESDAALLVRGVFCEAVANIDAVATSRGRPALRIVSDGGNDGA